MAFVLFQINADMRGIREALERIAVVVERVFPPSIVVDEPVEPRKVEMSYVDPVRGYQEARRQAIERGEDPDQWAYMPPQIGRR